MMIRVTRKSAGTGGTTLAALASLAAMALMPLAAQAQTAAIYGSLGNFDVANYTGHEAHGFEVQVDAAQPGEIAGGFGVNRYGSPNIQYGPTGALLRWSTPFDPATQTYLERTLPLTPGTFFGGTCYQWNGASYANSGCEHFGVWTLTGASGAVHARWLVDDPANPGSLVGVDPPVAVAAPQYYVVPPAAPGLAPQVAVEVQAPEPAEAPNLFGDAQWMRVFVTQLPVEVTLDQLVTDNPIVPQDPTKLESNYQIIQDEPVAGGNGKRKRVRNQGSLLPTTRSVVRRIELYEFTGNYDPVTHEALCADTLCNAPAAGEIGNLISAQMTAVLVQSDSVTVTRAGNGQVDSADKRISCGSKCVAPYDAGTLVQLTAKAGSGSTFAGWTGACTGTQPTCAVAARGHVDVGASFAAPPATGGGGGGGAGGGGGGGGGGTAGTSFTLSIGRSNVGTVTSNLPGINCGNTCSAKFAAGTVVTLTATPPAGKSFASWSGGCVGIAPTCQVTLGANTSVQANFNK